MRRVLFRNAIGIFCLVALVAVWIAGARPLSLLLDRIHTVEIESRPMTQLGVADADHGTLLISDLPLSTASPDNGVYPMTARLQMVWRYEQYFYDDWASGFATRGGTTGLIHVDIRP